MSDSLTPREILDNARLLTESFYVPSVSFMRFWMSLISDSTVLSLWAYGPCPCAASRANSRKRQTTYVCFEDLNVIVIKSYVKHINRCA